MRLILGLVAVMLLGVAPARAQDPGSAFSIGGIDLDVAAKTVDEARLGAYREAQRRAWPQLWSRMTGNPAAAAPKLSDSALDAIVAGIEIEAERFSTNRYIARLGVVFDGARVGSYLGGTAQSLSSAPMLLVPVLDDGGARTVYERRSPWLKAWARFRAGVSPIQYVRAQGIAGDALLLNAYQAHRPDRQLWRNILTRFQAADVLITEAKLDRSYPGGPVVGTFTARHGPDGTLLARFRLRANSVAELDPMLDAAVRRIDGFYANALRNGALRSDPALALDLTSAVNTAPVIALTSPTSGVEVNVATPDAAAWAALEGALHSVPTVDGVSIVSLSLGGTSRIRLGYSNGYDWLLYQLDQHGLRLESGMLRRKAAGDAPIPRPVTAEEVEAAQEPMRATTTTNGPAEPRSGTPSPTGARQ